MHGGLNQIKTINSIPFYSDGLQLQGWLHLPGAPRPPLVIGCHGLFSNSQSPKQQDLARRCTDHGMAFFRFDFRGCGDSQGRLVDGLELTARQRDLLAAMRMLMVRSEIDGRYPALFGSSFGGTVALAAAAELPVRALVVFAAPLRNASVTAAARRDVQQSHPGIPRDFQLPRFDVTRILHRLNRVLVVHGLADKVVTPSAACEIFDRVGLPKELYLQQQGDHLMSDVVHQQVFMTKTIRWFRAAESMKDGSNTTNFNRAG